MENSFKRFLSLKNDQKRKHLKLMKQILEKNNIKVFDHLDDEDPYVYVESMEKGLSFGGVRIYSIGDELAFRVQKKEKTHPYGPAYSIDIQEIYTDLLDSKDVTDDEIGVKLMKMISEGFKKFFTKSREEEKKTTNQDMGGGLSGINNFYSNQLLANLKTGRRF